MLEDNVRIRSAHPEEAEMLSELAWLSQSYWDYSLEQMGDFSAILSVTQEFLEQNPTYLIENEALGEVIGFYSLEQESGGQWWLRRLWVAPAHIGTGIGQLLFLHACELAETMGAEKLCILSDPNAEAFFVRMGAECVGEKKERYGAADFLMPVLEIKV